MKKIPFILLVCLLLLLTNYSKAQDDSLSENTINTRFFPTSNSDFSYYFLRKDMRLSEFLISTEFSSFEDGSTNFKTKLFLPVHNSKKITYDIPLYLEKYEFRDSESDFKKNVYSVFGQSILGFYPSERLNFSHIIEFRFKGDGDNLTQKTGNYLAQFLTARYRLRDKVYLTGGALVGLGWDNQGDSQVDVKPALMLTWKPNPKLSLMVGMPAAAIEWSMPLGFDFVFHSLLDGGDINITTAVRKNLGSKFDITGRFVREGYSELNVPGNFVNPFLNDSKTASFYYNKMQLELGVRPNRNTVIQLIGGYSMGGDLEIKRAFDKTTTMNGRDNLYFGLSLNRRFQL